MGWEAFEDTLDFSALPHFVLLDTPHPGPRKHSNSHRRSAANSTNIGSNPQTMNAPLSMSDIDFLQHQISNNPENIQTHTEDLRRIQQTLAALVEQSLVVFRNKSEEIATQQRLVAQNQRKRKRFEQPRLNGVKHIETYTVHPSSTTITAAAHTGTNTNNSTIPVLPKNQITVDWSSLDRQELKKLRAGCLEEDDQETLSVVEHNKDRGVRMLSEAVKKYHDIVVGDDLNMYGINNNEISIPQQQMMAMDNTDTMMGHLHPVFDLDL
jgi:hypothetical protein